MSIYGDNIFLEDINNRQKIRDFHNKINTMHRNSVERDKKYAVIRDITSNLRKYISKHNIIASTEVNNFSRRDFIDGHSNYIRINVSLSGSNNNEQDKKKLKEVLSNTNLISSYLNSNISNHSFSCVNENPFTIAVRIS